MSGIFHGTNQNFYFEITRKLLWSLAFVKFINSEKATKFCEISTLLLAYVVPVKRKVEISQNFVAFSEYMNLNLQISTGIVIRKMKTLEMIVYFTPQTSFVRTVSFKHSPKEIEKISNFQQLYTSPRKYPLYSFFHKR